MSLVPEDALELQFLRDARLSPDGKSTAYTVSSSDRSDLSDACTLWLLDLESRERHALTDEASIALSPRWSPDGRTIAYYQAAPVPAIMVVPLDGSQAPRAVTDPGTLVAGAPSWSPDGRQIAVSAGTMLQPDDTVVRITSRVHRAEGFGPIDLMSLGICVVDLEDNSQRTLVHGSARFQCTEPQWSPQGNRILFQANFDEDGALFGFPTLRCVDVVSGEVEDVLGSWGGCQSAAWLPDGERIAFVGAAANWRVMTNMEFWVTTPGAIPERRTPAGPWHVSPRIYQDGPIWDLVSTGGLVVESENRASITVQKGGVVEIWDVSLVGPIECNPVVTGDRSCILLDAKPDVGHLYVGTDFFQPTELFLVDPNNVERQLTHLNSALLERWPAIQVDHLDITAHDGHDFEGWFLSPAGSDGPLPTIMHIHGGPYTAVGHAFRFDFRMLASNGMGVVFSNFRGSAGYGQEHMDAIGNDWGNAGFPDHMATIDEAISRGLTDGEQLGVWGASHGGLATSWIVGHTDRFTAAVAESAITDFTMAYYTSDLPDVWQAQHGGTPADVGELMRMRSPLTYATNAVTPTLMLHCEGDLRCPLSQAEAFQRALLDAGCISELVIIRDGNHIADATGPAPIRLAQDQALLDWFQRYLLQDTSTPKMNELAGHAESVTRS